jgi:hypothetical protein
VKRTISLMLVALSLLGCVTVSKTARVRTALVEAGLSPKMASCMADRLVDRLSDDELRQLGHLAKLPRKDVGHMSIRDIADRVSAIGDPHIVKVVTSSGLGCAIAS